MPRLFHPHLYLPAIHAGAVVPPVLLDNFAGSGALTAHTPDIYPVGSAWVILNGTFGNLSGGYLPYTSGTFGKSTIDCGLADFEITWRSKHFTAAGSQASGIHLRGTAAASGYAAATFRQLGIDYIQWGIPGSTIIDLGQPGSTTSKPLTLVNGNYYTWKLMIKGQHARLWDEAGVLTLAGSAAANLTNTYVGTYNEQPYGNWDYIQVKPITKRFITFSVCGDSISNDNGEWPFIVGARHNNGYSYPINHAVSGSSVMSQMAGQITQCITDNADFTIVALGTNDGTTNITSTYQTQVERLWTALHKPIFACGVFPKTDTAARAVENGYIGAAVAAAQANGVNVTYWNTDGWIDPTIGVDTSDGLHPNNSGQAKITTQVLARI